MHTPASRRQLRAILGFATAYTAVAAIAAIVRGNREFVFYIVVMLVIAAALMAVHRRVGISAGLLWCLAAWGLAHMAGGLVPVAPEWHRGLDTGVLYNLWLVEGRLKYDQVVHVYGFAVTTWLCWQALSARTLGEDGRALRPTPGLMVLCAAAGMGFGALNEVVEFVATLSLPRTNVGGYVNTGWDLVSNLVGACLAAAVILWLAVRAPRGEGR